MPSEGKSLAAECRKRDLPVESELREVVRPEANHTYGTWRLETDSQRSLERRVELSVQSTVYKLDAGAAKERRDTSPENGRIRSAHPELPFASEDAPRRFLGCQGARRPIAFDVPTDKRC